MAVIGGTKLILCLQNIDKMFNFMLCLSDHNKKHSLL